MEFNGAFNITGWAKIGMFLGVDNFAMVNNRKACDMSNVSYFVVKNVKLAEFGKFKYFCLVCSNLRYTRNYAKLDNNACIYIISPFKLIISYKNITF